VKPQAEDHHSIRRAIATIPGDVSNDAVGINVANIEDIYAPESHSAALDPNTPIVLGHRGTGKSFWASVLGQAKTRSAAAIAYPRLNLRDVEVQFGYTGIGGEGGITSEAIDAAVPPNAGIDEAKAFWWATILSAAARTENDSSAKPKEFVETGRNWEAREDLLAKHERRLLAARKTLLVVYDALDTVARTWPRRHLLTEALLEVVWAMRAFRSIRPKLFLRPDQIEDDALRFVELSKLKNGALRLEWSSTDLYGLFFSRLAMTTDHEARTAFDKLLAYLDLRSGDDVATRDAILTRRWSLVRDTKDQERLMALVAGPFMGQGTYAYKKGSTYKWPITHLADAFAEVTPRSFLGMMIAAAKHGAAPEDRVITAEGIRHGLRAASKTRVDQLHHEFPWIKGVLAPLAGLLLPQDEDKVFEVWRRAKTIDRLLAEAEERRYLPPFPDGGRGGPRELFEALERIGVMSRRQDDRIDMPDLFRVAARLLKKGSIAPA
jgi:hypothetical protein